MPKYSITFDAPGFAVTTDSAIALCIEIMTANATIQGVDRMDITVETNSPAFRLKVIARGRPPANREVPFPAGTAMPTWTGTDTPLATVVIDADGTALVTPRDAPGTFVLTAVITDTPWGTATANITLTQEQPDHIDIVQVPV